ncbi:hypothetical protein HOT95_gp012 [Vibrio phage vB_VpS_PG07]|uniref:Uncharacterized protein n=1 Tax=Vibrio phage vB_VpS_PG07 TaxID=2301664 RepID=A0A385E709_9CAUD|nr:hypothetical protein HOT95_gp012 [Vibrio phage vB_VpS_PG07]AXQ66637.1 hypothetical protein [Vibrio phage vB_VpS_PG07]
MKPRKQYKKRMSKLRKQTKSLGLENYIALLIGVQQANYDRRLSRKKGAKVELGKIEKSTLFHTQRIYYRLPDGRLLKSYGYRIVW